MAGKDWNDVKPGPVKWRQIYMHENREVVNTSFPDITFRPLVYSCNQCSEPACVLACGAGAISKRDKDGIVLVDRKRCVNMQNCLSACPYGAIQIPDDTQEYPDSSWQTPHPPQKCTFRLDRWGNGQKPACVMSCPQRALDAGTADYILRTYPAAVPATEVDGFPEDLHAGKHTLPNFYIKKR